MAQTRGKITVIFQHRPTSTTNQIGSLPSGWTETWYTPWPSGSYTALLALAKGYVAVRKEMLGVGAFVEAVRVSDDEVFRDSLWYEFLKQKENSSSIFTTPVTDGVDVPWTDLMCRVEAGPFKRRTFWVAGLPDEVTETWVTQGVDPTFVFSKAWVALVNYIIANFSERVAVRPATTPPTFTLQGITNIIPRQVRIRKKGRPFGLLRGLRPLGT